MTTNLLLGCIADDFTGATDLANNLVRSGLRVMQTIGVQPETPPPGTQVVVVSLKSRTIPVAQAVEQSLEALAWLTAHGAQQIYFKYCSTFDSTAQGNIGPVTEALMKALGTDFTVATPAFPENGRTIFNGHLFVGKVLLNESGMQNHPLTPMRDANLVRVLQEQTQAKVGLVDYSTIRRGAVAIKEAFQQLRAQGIGIAIVDSVSNDDLKQLGLAVKDMPLLTAGSGLAIGLASNHGIKPSDQASQLPKPQGTRAIVSGSCSLATNRQVRHFLSQGGAGFAVDPMRIVAGDNVAAQILDKATAALSQGPVLIYSTADVTALKAIQEQHGADHVGALVEETLAAITRGLVERGVGQLIVAGGETSGACVQALDVKQLQIGGQIDPGVPWCYAPSKCSTFEGLHITLKSGNFGTDDFFVKAFGLL